MPEMFCDLLSSKAWEMRWCSDGNSLQATDVGKNRQTVHNLSTPADDQAWLQLQTYSWSNCNQHYSTDCAMNGSLGTATMFTRSFVKNYEELLLPVLQNSASYDFSPSRSRFIVDEKMILRNVSACDSRYPDSLYFIFPYMDTPCRLESPSRSYKKEI